MAMKKISSNLKKQIAKKKKEKRCHCEHDEAYGYIFLMAIHPNQSDYNFVRNCAKEGLNVGFMHGNPHPPCPPGGCK